jgi:D-alanyl-D-alanine endopeptidase (penicillin-binding protein 7)
MSMRFVAMVAACLLAAGSVPMGASAGQDISTRSGAQAVRIAIKSGAALVIDQESGELLYAKNEDQVVPIASITKLMTAMVILDSGVPLLESVTVDRADVDRYKGSRSKLAVGLELTRSDLLKLALMASENRAASALARTYPGGSAVFIDTMNRKAQLLGMTNTRFVDATGLNPGNVSTAEDLAKLVAAAHEYPVIRDYTTAESARFETAGTRRPGFLQFVNSNRLVRSSAWDIGLSKTGYISEAGRCLVMQARIAEKSLIIVLLDSWGKMTRIGDANRIKRWLERDIALRDSFRS